MTEFQITDPLDHPNWDTLWAAHPDYSFFHSAAWAKVLCEAYHYRPAYLTVRDIDHRTPPPGVPVAREAKCNGSMGRVRPVLSRIGEAGGEHAPSLLIPLMEINSRLTGKRGVSLPFSDYCEPILTHDAPIEEALHDYRPRDGDLPLSVTQDASFEEAIHFLIQYGKQAGWKTLEVRGGKQFASGIAPSARYYVHTLTLQPDHEKMPATFTSAIQRNIKKAIREGVEVRLETSKSAIQEFYRLNGLTRRDHGLPSQPFSFFQRIYDHIISQKQGFVALATYRNEVIAGAVYFSTGEKGYYKYGASDKKFQNLRANNLVMWEAIQHFAKNGYASLCLGRTDPTHDGLRQFKLGWAPREEMVHYYKYNLLKDTYLSENGSARTWQNPLVQRMPIPVLNRIGSLLYRHMG